MHSCLGTQVCGHPLDYHIDLKYENVTSNPQINYGITSFDNLFRATLTIFQVITLEGWSDILYNYQDSTNVFAAAFFSSIVLIGSFFLLNLILAVIM